MFRLVSFARGFILLTVTEGYCLKRYMAYLLRLRKQNEVEAKNKYYYNLLYEALPPAAVSSHQRSINDKSISSIINQLSESGKETF